MDLNLGLPNLSSVSFVHYILSLMELLRIVFLGCSIIRLCKLITHLFTHFCLYTEKVVFIVRHDGADIVGKGDQK